MFRGRLLLMILGLLLSGLCGIAQAGWNHFAPSQAPSTRPLRLEFLDPDSRQAPVDALLHLELDGRTVQPLAPVELAAGRIVFEVPPERLSGRELAYRAEIRVEGGLIRLPANGRWRVALAPAGELALVELLSKREIEAGEEALLAFSALDDQVDLAGGQLWIDGQRVSGVEADPWLLTWRGPLAPGLHQVELRLKDRQGRDLQPQHLQVRVAAPDAVPGGFAANAWQEFNMDFLDSRGDQWQRYHAGQASFRAWRGKGEAVWTLKGRVLLSALDLERDELQPQSRLNLEAGRRGFLLGVGDRQPEYSSLLLSGTRVRGLELETDLKGFGLHLVGGRAQQARDPIFRSSIVDVDTHHVVDFAGAFTRRLYAADLRFGRRYGLLEGGLSVLKAKDDAASIDPRPPAEWGTDSLARISPQDNAALAARLDLNALRGRLSGRNQVAFSLHNSNITDGAWTKEDMATIGAGDGIPDPSTFDNIIIINPYFSPMDLADGDFLSSMALSSNWQLALGANETSLDFRRVGGAYRSLGNSFLSSDQQEIRVSDRVRLLGNQLYADLGLGRTTDNLDGQYDSSVGTTTRDMLSLGLGWYPRGRDLQVRLGLDRQQEANEADDLVADDATETDRLEAHSQQIEGSLTQLRLGLSGSLDWLGRRHQWNLSLVNQGYSDEVGRLVDPANPALHLRADRSFGANQLGLGWQVVVGLATRLEAGLTVYGSSYDDATLADYGYWNLRSALGRSWLGGRLHGTVRGQFQSVTSESASTDQAFTRTDLGGQVDWNWRQGLALSGRLDWQSWAGDREDSFLKVVLRLSQEF